MGLTKLLRKIATGSSEHYSDNNAEDSRQINITPKLANITVQHEGNEVIIERNQDTHARINDLFAKTSRPCPPFCVQPMSIATGVETIAELELLDYLQQSTLDDSILVVDSRIKEWVDMGTIPSAIHIPWTALTLSNGTSLNDIITILRSTFGVKIAEGVNAGEMSEAFANGKISEKLDFSDAKTLVMFCNGSWCGQTPEAVLALLELSYPANKIKYYRDGMQGWLALGLTTIPTEKKSRRSKDNVEPTCQRKPYKVVSPTM